MSSFGLTAGLFTNAKEKMSVAPTAVDNITHGYAGVNGATSLFNGTRTVSITVTGILQHTSLVTLQADLGKWQGSVFAGKDTLFGPIAGGLDTWPETQLEEFSWAKIRKGGAVWSFEFAAKFVCYNPPYP